MIIFLIAQMVGLACGSVTVLSCIPVPVLRAVAKTCNHQDLVLKTSDLLRSSSVTDGEPVTSLLTVTAFGLPQSCLKINFQNHYRNHSILAICGSASVDAKYAWGKTPTMKQCAVSTYHSATVKEEDFQITIMHRDRGERQFLTTGATPIKSTSLFLEMRFKRWI